MQDQSKQSRIYPLLAGLVLGTFALTSVHPGWVSVVELVTVLGFVGYVLWLNPAQEPQFSKRDFDLLKEELDKVRDKAHSTEQQLVGLKMKLGFQLK